MDGACSIQVDVRNAYAILIGKPEDKPTWDT
jgi:hypothetical protein